MTRVAFLTLAAVFSGVTQAGVTFRGEFLQDPAIKFVARDVSAMLGDVAGDIVLKSDATLPKCHWGLDSDGRTLTVSGCDEQGVIYGLYTFLEKYAGFRWYAPDVTKRPNLKGWTFPKVRERAHCAYFYFNQSPGDREPADIVWTLRNKQSNRTAYTVGTFQGSPTGNHTFPHYAAEIRKTHPELFGKKPSASGKPCRTLCLTDPLVRRLTAEQMIRYIEKDRGGADARVKYSTPVIYDLGQADGASGEECMCETCKAMAEREGSYAGPNIDFCNAVARIVKEKHPEVLVRTLAYAYVADPPKTVVADENVVVRFCRAWVFDPLVPGTPQAKDLESWSGHAKTLGIWSYWRTYQGQMYPFVKRRADIEAELRFCHENNARHYYAEDEGPTERSFAMMQYWLFLKMCENPYQPIKPLADEFLAAYYGRAAGVMTRYLDYLESRQEATQAYLDRAFFQRVNAWLDEAERLAADDEAALRHIHWERTVVDRSMFGKLSALLKEGYAYEREKVLARFERNAVETLKGWSGWNRPEHRKTRDARIAAVRQEAKLYAHCPIAIPEMFAGKEVDVLEWNQLPVALGTCKYVDDPQSETGTSFTPEGKDMSLPYEIGMHNHKRAEGDSLTFYREDIPQDGKFHCYRIGTAVIQDPLAVFYHKSWRPRTFLRTLGIIPEARDVWISMRFQGPSYVDGSTEPDGVFFNRLFFVKGSVLDLYERPQPDDALLFKAETGEVTATGGVWNSAPLGDPEKLTQDLYVRGRVSYENVKPGAMPFGGLRCLDAKGRTLFTVPVATFYPGNDDGRKFETVISASRIRNRLRRQDGRHAAPCTLHFSASVPADSEAVLRMNGIAVVPVREKGFVNNAKANK